MSTSQLNPSPSGVLGSIAKLIRLTADQGVEWSQWLRPINDTEARGNLATYLMLGCPRLETLGSAQMILGDDFIPPNKTGFIHSAKQLEYFEYTSPRLETLLWLHKNDHMLVAGPNQDLNLLQLRSFTSKLISPESGGWYSEDQHTFSQTDTIKAGQWLMLRKGSVPNSQMRSWEDQSKLIKKPERVPNVAEALYGILMYFMANNGACPITDISVRTSSIDADGQHVSVSYDAETGCFEVDSWNDESSIDILYIASARD